MGPHVEILLTLWICERECNKQFMLYILLCRKNSLLKKNPDSTLLFIGFCLPKGGLQEAVPHVDDESYIYG